MKKMIAMLAILATSIAGFAQKTINDENAEARPISSFTSIEVSSGIDLYLSQGEEALAVSARDAKTRANIRAEVDGNVLKIGFKHIDGIKMNWNTRGPLKAYVSYKTLNSLIASGGCDVIIVDKLVATTLSVNISGGSDMKGKIEAETMTLHQSAGSDVKIQGSVKSLTLNVSAGSDFSGYDLSTETCDIHASSGSDVEISVQKEITAEASGGADVHWKGSATPTRIKANAAGSVTHKS